MYLEVDFESGDVGRYACTAASTVTITEPVVTMGENPATSAFALDGVVAVKLVDAELAPAVSPALVESEVEAPAAPADAPPVPAEDVVPADPADAVSPDPAAAEPGPIAAASDAETPAPAVDAAVAAVDAVVAHETPEAQLEHATAVKADLEAALEKWPADPDLSDALALITGLIADLTPSGS